MAQYPRRQLLAAGLAFAVGGCSSETGNQSPSTQTQNSAPEPASPTTHSAPTTDSSAEDESSAEITPKVCLGNAAPISIEVADSGENVTVTTLQEPTDAVNTAALDYSERIINTAAEHGMNVLHSILDDKSLLGPGIIVSQHTFRHDSLTCPEREKIIPTKEQWGEEVAPTVTHEHYYSRSGELLVNPEPTYEEIQAATPAMARVELHSDDESQTTILPVICRKQSSQEL
ncbi:hypothetical protein SAMN05216388_103820 [Halorientalis persicus]|uniref:Uncharacterized protein n=1 Tax=Halorientalis persicus TaxID=1367881 RepID=A0A1H8VIY2_9EURY|nr:hypothetical protein [Halorientalis persicus]SEP15331.1 hypothetical protein SAMN05216388_103820 [Halorientalis persicus]